MVDRSRITTTLSRNASLDSIASVIIPWKTVHQKRHSLIAEDEMGRGVNPLGFFLCMSAVMLLSSGIGICAATVWSVIYRAPYTYLIDGTILLGVNIFSFCAGTLGIPCFWIACTSHNTGKNYIFLPLLMALLGFSVILFSVSITISALYKSQLNLIKHKSPKFIQETMLSSMQPYDRNYNFRQAWDKVQQRLKCCGTRNYTDWIHVRNGIPPSCCSTLSCIDGNMYSGGCLKKIILDLYWETCLTIGLNCIVTSVQLFAFFLVTFMYVKMRLGARIPCTIVSASNSDLLTISQE